MKRGAIVGIIFMAIACMQCKKDTPLPLPEANFFAENNDCTAPCSLYFYDNSKAAVSWNWRFGNGVTSSIENPKTLYPASGEFEVWLFVKNGDGEKDSVRKTITIN